MEGMHGIQSITCMVDVGRKDQQKHVNGNTKIAKQSIVLKFIMDVCKDNPKNVQ